jgi:GTP-binding protein
MKPVVAIVGRPNVGKSTLFNRIVRERRALVADVPGVTRDRLYQEVEWNGRVFLLVDTGGFEPTCQEGLLSLMREQTELAIEEADIIIFVLDVRDGLTPSDRDAAELLRRTSKPVHYVVNKVDGPRWDAQAMEFYELGADRLHLISAKHGRGVTELLEAVTERLPLASPKEEPGPEEVIRVAVVGRPNVGKSSLVNRLCGTARSLVSPEPGTTHDAVDTEIRWHGRRFLLIDTAGIRKKARTRIPLEKYCVIKALRSIDRAHVALLLVDATEGATDQDAKIGSYIVERGRGCIVLANKWDLVPKDSRTHDDFVSDLKEGLRHLEFAPVMTVSALTGQRLGRILGQVMEVYRSWTQRIPTSRLNPPFRRWVEEHPPPLYKGRRIKFYYCTQAEIAPPTFVAFTNCPEGVQQSYIRYLVRRTREEFGFEGAPIRFQLRERAQNEIRASRSRAQGRA